MQTTASPIRSKELLSQPIDFRNLRFGATFQLLPTDVDGLFDYHDKGWVLLECKYRGAELSWAQETAYLRACTSLGKEKPTLFIIADHSAPYPGCVDAGNATVRYLWYNGTRREPPLYKGQTVREAMSDFLAMLDHDELPKAALKANWWEE